MSHPKAKLMYTEHNHGGVDWCRAFHYKILINPLTFAKILVKKNPENVVRIRRSTYVRDNYLCVWKPEWKPFKVDEFLKLVYRRNASKENSEYWIEFADGNIAVVYCRRREAIIVEVSL